jgi:TIR domain
MGGVILQIFLSYASQDKDIAEPIAFSLRARSHKVFFDRDDLPPGGEYDMRIQTAVERSALFIFLLSPDSIAKGRFTLTELEFARRKWRNADGHVLPVMVKTVRFEEIPNFLKSVTVLEPQGNIAAEVAATVDPLAQSAAGGQMALYGGLGIASGLLTWPAYQALSTMEGWFNFGGGFQSPLELYGIPISLLFAGLVFAISLCVAFAYYFRFNTRQLVILPFVLAGWFAAMQVVTTFSTQGVSLDQDQRCAEMRYGDDASADASLANKCLQFWRGRFQQTQNREQDLAVSFIAGAIGAFLTAIGAPLATRRTFPIFFLLATTLVGAVVATMFNAVEYWAPNLNFTFLFVPWQALVAGAIGRSIR